jgi:hypothetical protein
MHRLLIGLVLCALAVADADAQSRRRRPAPKPAPKPVTEAAKIECTHVLGDGVATKRTFCDIMTGTDPVGGTIVRLPARQGAATLTFELHNRHMYSAELVERGRGYVKATATIGVLGMDKTLLTRAIIMTEFRTAADLFDRVPAGPGATGAKAVAPIGDEVITVEIADATVEAVSLLGEKLVAVRADGTETITGAGRPVALVSNVRLQYRPAAAKPKPKPKPKR